MKFSLRVVVLIWTLAIAGQAVAGEWTANHFVYKPALGARGATEKGSYDIGLDRIDSRLGKEIWVGDPNYGPTLQDAITAIDTQVCILRVPAGVHNLTDNLTIPANITLKVERGATLAISSAKTLTINGTLEAGRYQIFSLTGTAKVSHRNPAAYPEWFGFGTTASASGNAAALQAALNSLSAGGKVTLAGGSYNVATGVVDLGADATGIVGITLEGAAPVGYGGLTNNATVLVANGTGILVNATTLRGGGVYNLALDGNGTASVCLNITGAMGSRFERLIVKDAADVGLWVQSAANNGVYGSSFKQIYAKSCGGPGIYFKAHNPGYINSDVFEELTASGCGLTGAGASGLQYGMVFDTVYNSVLQTSTAESNVYNHGLYVTGCQNFLIDGGLYEGNGVSNGTPANCYQIYVNGTYYVGISSATRIGATGGTKYFYLPSALGMSAWNQAVVSPDWPGTYTINRMCNLLKDSGICFDSFYGAYDILGFRTPGTKSYPSLSIRCDGSLNWRNTDVVTPDGGNLRNMAAGVIGTDNCFQVTEGLIRKRVLVSSSDGILTLPNTGCYYSVTLTENITSIVLPTARDGKEIRIKFVQAATGGPYTVAGWSGVLLAGGSFTMTSTAGKADILTLVYDLGKTIWYEVSRSQSM
jgi:hypothetical protein